LLQNIFNGGLPRISGLQIVLSNAIALGDFLVGDFASGAQYFDRMEANVRMSDQDRDNFVTNQITMVVESRTALAVYHTGAFVKGTISSAISNYSA